MITRAEVEKACRDVMGREIYEAMVSARIGFITIMDAAGKKAFIENMEGGDVDDLRAGMAIIANDGFLND